MKRLTVLYDASCGFCVRCAGWLKKQPAFLDLEFLRAGSADARQRYPALAASLDELVVVSDEGFVYRDTSAWIMCLYALREFREMSMRLAGPALRPFARAAFQLLSTNRRRISRWLGLATPGEIVETLREADPSPEPGCKICQTDLATKITGPPGAF